MYPFRSQPRPEKATAPEQFWKTQELSSVQHLRPPHDAYSGEWFRTTIYHPVHNQSLAGRSVPVFKGDVATALRQLKAILASNNVRSQNVRDERHEKKGEKRNRLKSLRWRRRFAHEVRLSPMTPRTFNVFTPWQVRKRVQLVNEIRARGA